MLKLFKRKPILQKREDFSKMELAFTDSNGKKYFRYVSEFDMPLERQKQLQRYLIEFSTGLEGKELNMFIEAILQAATGEGKDLQGKLRDGKADIATIIFLAQEMKLRQDIAINENLLFKIVSAIYIREDQNPAVWDDELEMIKVKQFEKDSQGVCYDFFYSAGIQNFFPFFKNCKKNYAEYVEQARVKSEAMQRLLLSSLGQGLVNTLKKEKKN